ncbi:MAG: SHD1 domain-containing protein, partial [Thermoguttaceae bacterium]
MNRLKYPMLTVGLWLAPILSLAAEPSTHQHRTWTDSTGKYTIQAEFVEFKDGKVRLRKENGKEVRIPIEKLSDADRELVQQQSQGKPAPENAPRELAAHRIKLEPPGPREFILDKANELAPATREQLREKCDALLTDKATPIVIVTIESMAEYGADDIRIETFARLLFDQWQVGIAKLGNQNSNTGILLLVSVGDRKSRIELGAG